MESLDILEQIYHLISELCVEWHFVYISLQSILLVFQTACQILQSFSQHLCPVTLNACIFKTIAKFDRQLLEALHVCALSAQPTCSWKGLDEDITSTEMDILAHCVRRFACLCRSVKRKAINQPWHYCCWWGYWFQLFLNTAEVLITCRRCMICYRDICVRKEQQWPQRGKTKRKKMKNWRINQLCC